MRDEIIIKKLLAYTEKIINYCAGYDYDSFVTDSKLVEACVFNLSQMGELCKNVDSNYAQRHTQIPWSEMYGLRNRIVHDYDGVNMLLVWEIISGDLPELREALSELVK